MEIIDTHAHLYAEEFDNDLKQVIENAKKQSVSKIILPAIDSQTHQKLINISQQYNNLFVPLMGLHPTSAKDDYKKELNIVEKHLAENTFFKGIGEIGIDLYWDKTHLSKQKEAFKIQVNWAKQLKIPIVIHTRNSFEETFKILEPLQDGGLTGIFHCFGGSIEEANLITQLGFKLGIGGIVTFKNSDLKHTLTKINIKHIVLETDSPYLAPVPYRGKRNQSSYTAIIAKQIAEIYNLTIEQVATTTTTTAKQIFNIQ